MNRCASALVRPAEDPKPVGIGYAFGTFGELLQGVLPEHDLDFLVTFPIAEWSRATFTPDAGSRVIEVIPEHKEKSRRLAADMMRAFGHCYGGRLELVTTLPEGKGFASSSADLVATARAVGHALRLTIDEAVIERFLRRIEPSDGVMYDEIVSFYHRQVRLRERIGRLPGLTIIANDEGGHVDTVCFNRIPKSYSTAEKEEYAVLLSALVEAVRGHDLGTVGRVATRSTQLHARIRAQRNLGQILQVSREIDALGVVTAHSGTIVGMLLDDRDPDLCGKTEHAARRCAGLPGTTSVYRSMPSSDFQPVRARITGTRSHSNGRSE